MIHRLRLRRTALIGVALAAVAAGCAGDDEGSSETPAASETTVTTSIDTEPPPDTTTETPGATGAEAATAPATEPEVETTVRRATTSTEADVTTTTERAVGTTLVNVYWGWIVQNPVGGSPERIGAGSRMVRADAPTRHSLEAMFAGVDAVEREIGMTSSIPEGTRVLGISVDGATATVDLSAEFERPGGTLDESMRLAQVVFAVTQFDAFDRVKFHVAGEPRDTILSHGVEVGDGLTRDDFPGVRARIMIEEPSPGAQVTDPLVVRGEANTFEANVRYAITAGAGDGSILADGFTTATAGNGTWGAFEIEVDLTDSVSGDVGGPGSIILWEDDPRTGGQVDVVEIPVVLPSP